MAYSREEIVGMVRSFRHTWQCRLVPLVFWCAVIFAFSEIPGSGLHIEPPLWYVLERKSAHVFEYAVLAFLSFRFFSVVYSLERFFRVALLSGIFALAYGVLDEFHQAFVFGGLQMMRFAEPFKEYGMHYEVTPEVWEANNVK